MKLILVDHDGVIWDEWELDGWDLTKPLARSVFTSEVCDEINRRRVQFEKEKELEESK